MPTQTRKQQIKEKVMAMEQENYDKLLLYRSDDSYHKMVGHSALFYAGNIAKRIGRRYNLRLDTDHYVKSDDGVISIVVNDELINKFLAIGIKQDSKKNKDILEFKLPQKFTDQDLAQFRELLKRDEKQINAIVLPKSPIPTLYVYLDNLLEMIYHNAKNMPYFGKDVIGKEMVDLTNKMFLAYLEFANDNIDKKRMATILYRNAMVLKNQMKIVEVLHMINNRNICRILEIVVAVERLARKYYQNER